jgi:uncharacterized membrane protein
VTRFCRRVPGGDDGSMLPLVIGMVVVVVALIAVVTDAGALWLARRSLQSTVDGAALAGAQGVDLAAVYAGGATGDLELDPLRARSAVRTYLRQTPSDQPVRLTRVLVTTTEVTIDARTTVSLPFTSFLTGRGVAVVAEATAVLRVP